jgi:hypothetical protein
VHEEYFIFGCREFLQTSSQDAAHQAGERQSSRDQTLGGPERWVARIQEAKMNLAFAPATRALQHVGSTLNERYSASASSKLKRGTDAEHSTTEYRYAISIHRASASWFTVADSRC